MQHSDRSPSRSHGTYACNTLIARREPAFVWAHGLYLQFPFMLDRRTPVTHCVVNSRSGPRIQRHTPSSTFVPIERHSGYLRSKLGDVKPQGYVRGYVRAVRQRHRVLCGWYVVRPPGNGHWRAAVLWSTTKQVCRL